MIGWRPKTTKTGGLPNITFEPRKPKNLGTMLRDGAESVTGILLYHQIVKDPDLMHNLTYFDAVSSLPDKAKIGDTTAECLRQCEAVFGAKPAEGDEDAPLRFVGGDAWFGGVMTCVELKKRLGVDSTFIVKNNTRFYPKAQLQAIMGARHGAESRRGNWTVMTTKVAEVELMAIAYAWSERGVSFFNQHALLAGRIDKLMYTRCSRIPAI